MSREADRETALSHVAREAKPPHCPCGPDCVDTSTPSPASPGAPELWPTKPPHVCSCGADCAVSCDERVPNEAPVFIQETILELVREHDEEWHADGSDCGYGCFDPDREGVSDENRSNGPRR